MSLKLCSVLDNITLPENLNSAVITNVKFFRSDCHGEVTIQMPAAISFSDYEFLRDEFFDRFGCNNIFSFHFEDSTISLIELQKFLDSFIIEYGFSVLKNATIQFENINQKLSLVFQQEAEVESANQILEKLTYVFKRLGFVLLEIDVIQAEDSSFAIDEIVYIKNSSEEIPPKQNYADSSQYKYKKKSNKPEEYTKIKLVEVDSEMENVQFSAEIFACESTKLKSGKSMMVISLFDGSDAIVAKCFEGKYFTADDLSNISVGDYVSVYGSIKTDTFANNELSMMLTKLEKLEKEKKIDSAEEKRIELHMHTNMSEMDGVCNAESIVKYAWNLGHEAIAITDHADVQSFVKAYNTARGLNKKNEGRNFKVIFGCEFNLVDEKLTIVRNISDQELKSATFVAFDLETTGLSCYYDHIIEFGAVRVKSGNIIDRYQCFIKPPVPIPPFIINKTNITNEMVQDAKSFKDAIDDILNWIGDDILVAHNATFDYYFMNEELRRLNRPPLKNTVIDTLDMARAVLKDRRAYRLGNISRYYKIPYDEEVAHRADYDAEALSSVLNCLLIDAGRMGATTIRDLQEKIQDDTAYRKVRRTHVIALARNSAGLKSLYRLVTASNTKTLAVVGKASGKDGAEVSAEPRVLRSAVDEYRENLFIGTACYNNEIFELACNGDDERLEQAMQWYDYVELQPLANYSTALALGNIASLERLKLVQKRIISMAKKLNKPVIATSDAHYCSPEQKCFRDVYIMSQGVGGVTHPLYIRDENLRLRTKNPDQHIRLTDEMLKEFEWLDDKKFVREIVIDNPKKIVNLIEEIQPVPSGTFPPHVAGSDEKLKSVCYETAKKMYEFQGVIPEQVISRLDRELNSIIAAGYYVNYYISHLLVKKSNEDGYVVGSRGSVGSSFTATMSGITEVNPLQPHYLCPSCHYSEWIEDTEIKSGFDLEDKICPHCGAMMKGNGHNIPFETFLGFKGDKVPDIDLNFSNEYQAKAHAFTKEVFGEDHAFRAGTIGTVAEKTAFGYVSGYCEKMNITNMRKPMKEYLAKGCQDVKRTTGQHPGGIIIIPDQFDAEDFTAVQYPANDPNSEWKTTHYDFHDIHDNVLKFDILGHVDPTAMRLLQNIANVKPMDIPMNDPETLSLFYCDDALKADPRIYHQPTGALGLPEFGTKTTRRVLEETLPHKFSDLVIISGLSHGTDVWAGNAQTLVQQGHSIGEVIGCRDDIMTYLMNRNLEPIDSFKIMEDVRKGKGLTEAFEEKMRSHDVPEWYIDSCKKIKYMFPKAHAVAYVMMAVRIAWYKVHEPWNFYIQYLSLRCDAFEIETMVKGIEQIRSRMLDIKTRIETKDKINPVSNKEKSLFDTLEVCEELYARNYKICKVDLYKSKATQFCSDPNNQKLIIPPFTVVDGLGTNVAKSIEEARQQGDFISKEDLMKRTQLSATLVRKLEMLGCLDGLQDKNQISLF